MTDTWSESKSIGEILGEYFGSAHTKNSPLESASTVLFPKGAGRYDIEAKTSEGLKVFKDAVATDSDYDAQSETDGSLSCWIDAPCDEDENTGFEQTGPPSIETVIQHLEHACGGTRRQAIFEAEALAFHGDERTRLVGLLKSYINQHRNSNEREELIAVAAAIRKCVALLDESDMGWLSTLLEPDHRVPVSLEAELAIAKMVVRRYSQTLPGLADPHPDLSRSLEEIASNYLLPRVFKRERFSTIAMLAIQALILMRSQYAAKIIDEVNSLPFRWFRQQLVRRMNKIVLQIPNDVLGIKQTKDLIGKINKD